MADIKDKKTPRVIPNNIEAEQSILGAIMIDDNVAIEVLPMLNDIDFYVEAHKEIFRNMYYLQSVGKPIDVVTLSDRLTKEGKLESVGNIDYLIDLTNILPSSANYKYYFDIVKKNSMLRKIIHSSNEIIDNAYSSDDEAMALAFAEKKIFDISDNVENKELQHVNDTVNEVLKKYEEILTNPESNIGQRSYFKNLDSYTNGYKGGQVIVLAARPGCGKTSFAMNIVCNIARFEPEKVVAVFNLEMSISELTQRILLTTASVPQQHVLKGASADEFKRLWQAKKILEKSNVYIDDTASTTPEQIMSKCRRLKQLKGRLDFVVIDYLQLLKPHTKRSSIQQEVTEISRAIKIMAKDLNVPVLALSQTSRDLEKRDDGDPKMSDLRESGAIEQDADQIYFLVKEKGQEDQNMQVIDLHIVKHRSGECGKISFKWEGSMVKFTPITYEEAKYIKQTNSADTINEAIEHSENLNNKEDRVDMTPPSEVTGDIIYSNEDTEVEEVKIEVDNIDNMTPPPIEENIDWNAQFNEITKDIKVLDDNNKIEE